MYIPNNLYQIGKSLSFETLEFPYNLSSLSWKLMNPKWNYFYTNDLHAGDEIKQFSDELYELFLILLKLEKNNMIPGSYKTDIWRYIKLYNNGGVYADLDSAAIVNLDLINLIPYSDKIEIIMCPKEYGNFSLTEYNTHCDVCLNFIKIIQESHPLKKEGLTNGMFAVTKNSSILYKVIEETLLFFKIFKEMHKKNNITYYHHAITSIVDALLLNYITQENSDKVSETFIYSIHAPELELDGKIIKNFKLSSVELEITSLEEAVITKLSLKDFL
jgi:hypothetical protein